MPYVDMKPGVWEWYRVLRQYHHWSVIDSIRYALWLSGWIRITNA